MRPLYNRLAIGLLAPVILSLSACDMFNGEAGVPVTNSPNSSLTVPAASAEPTEASYEITRQTKADLEDGIEFYNNVLTLIDDEHFNGGVSVSQEEIAQGAMQGVLTSTYYDQFYNPMTEELDKTVVTFSDPDGKAKDRTITSLKIGDQTINTGPVTLPLHSYKDHANYLATAIGIIAQETDLSVMRLYEFALNGAIEASRDPHTHYQWKEASELMDADVKGEFGGIGIELRFDKGHLQVQGVMPGNPAETAGIQAGDEITHVNGELVTGTGLNKTVGKIRGKIGEDVKLTLKREGLEHAFDVSVTRGVIEIDAVEGNLIGENNDVLQLKIKEFSQKTVNDLYSTYHEAQDKATAQGNPITSVLLDVRGNPGGLLSTVKALSDLFLQEDGGEKDPIVATGKTAKDHQTFVDEVIQSRFDITGVNIAVLQNQGSASASEILAGALKDSGYPVIGTDSFGKGSVQTIAPLNKDGERLKRGDSADKHTGTLKLTIAAFFPGKTGLSNQQSGIIPNYKIRYNDVRDESAKNARREKDLGHSILSDQHTRAGNTPEHLAILKSELSGPLSKQQIKDAGIPDYLLLDMKIRDPENESEWLDVKMLDAEMATALSVVTGVASPYMDIIPYDKSLDLQLEEEPKKAIQTAAIKGSQKTMTP